jgi:predicted RNase H-like nuclease (RuvC/YqgF family)
MSIPEYDNAAKWAAFFRRLPFCLKALLGMALIVAVAIFLYARFGPIGELQRENLSLKNNLSQAQSEISSLRDKKDELHRENLHLKELIDPIKKKAELLYPEMETATAIAKLAEDLQNVRLLATRDVYKPLAQDQKDKMIAALKELQMLHSGLPVSVSIVAQQGSSPRARVANDFK